MGKIKFSPTKEELEQIYNEFSLKEIKEKYGICEQTLYLHLKKYNIKPYKRNNPKKQIILNPVLIKELYKEHQSIRKIVKILEKEHNIFCSIGPIFDLLHELGVEMRPFHFRKNAPLNERCFSLDNEESFYWSGFLAADGCIETPKDGRNDVINLGLQKKDTLHVKAFKDYVQTPAKVERIFCARTYKGVTKKHERHHVRFTSQQISDDLKRFGIGPRKSLTYKMPQWLLEHPLVHHFLRGTVDGDGCFSIERRNQRVRFTIVGSLKFVTQFQDILSIKCGIKANKISYQRKIYALSYSAITDLYKIVNFLYQDATVFLERKLIKALYGTFADRIPKKVKDSYGLISPHIQTLIDKYGTAEPKEETEQEIEEIAKEILENQENNLLAAH